MQNINYIIERTNGNRANLQNELSKISNFCYENNKIELEEILKLTNLAEDFSVSELADQCLAKNKKKTINILNENNSSQEDGILILKTFLYKLKRLKKLKVEMEIKNNIDVVISSFKPPIFWTLPQIQSMIQKINQIEYSIKKNSQITKFVINDFIIGRLEQTSN